MPHQHVQPLTLPNEQRIRTLAQNGYNLVVGMANWRSGQYAPLAGSRVDNVRGAAEWLGVVGLG